MTTDSMFTTSTFIDAEELRVHKSRSWTGDGWSLNDLESFHADPQDLAQAPT